MDDDLKKNPITFAWWKPGQYVVSAAVTSGGSTQVSTDTFLVTAPRVTNVTSSSNGVVRVGSYMDQGQMIRLADKDNFNKDGMYMNFVVAGNQSVPGVVGGIQLACNERVAQYNDLWKLSTNGTLILDAGSTDTVIYQNYVVQLGTTGDIINYDPHDGPGQGLPSAELKAMFIGDGMPVVPETYRMYAMFYPRLPAAVWVPIKVLEWGWEGYTQYVDGAWTPAQDGSVPVPVPSDPTNFPQWTQNTNVKDWEPYGGNVIARKLTK